MSLLSNDAKEKKSSGNALLIGNIAKEAKKKDSSVINSTIGMLYDEDGKLLSFNSVSESLNELNNLEKYSYGATAGSEEFKEVVNEWVFGQYYEDFKTSSYISTIATPGGTGAISNTIANYLSKGDKVLLPNPMWSNYVQIASDRGIGYETYNIFNADGKFDDEEFKRKCLELKESQKRVCVVINDPCHNPTGYSMNYFAWVSVIQTLNMIGRTGTPVILIYDMAYIDYDSRGLEHSRSNIKQLQGLYDNIITVLCFSGSKTLGLYGLRIGAQICIASKEEDMKEFEEASDFSARAMWSLSSVLGQNLIVHVFKNHKEEFLKELSNARSILIERANLFLKLAKENNLVHLPYNCGFFVSIPTKNPEEVYEKLKQKGLHILPIKDAIRLTLSSINKQEIERAVKLIKEEVICD